MSQIENIGTVQNKGLEAVLNLHTKLASSIGFDLTLAPDATLHNDTDLGFNVGYSLDLFRLSGSYDVLFDSGSFNLGPLVDENGTTQAASISVFDATFPLDFASETASFVV